MNFGGFTSEIPRPVCSELAAAAWYNNLFLYFLDLHSAFFTRNSSRDLPLEMVAAYKKEGWGFRFLGSKVRGSLGCRHLVWVSIPLNVLLLIILMFEKRGQFGAIKSQKVVLSKVCFQEREGVVVVVAGEGAMGSEHGGIPANDSRIESMRTTDPILSGGSCTERPALDAVINLDHGDPTMFEPFWRRIGDKATIVIEGWHSMSYFSKSTCDCWFLEPELAEEIRKLHRLVRNAETEGFHIVVGTGSTQLFQAALYALSPIDSTEPISVVSASPYYSSYPAVTDYLKSAIYRWAGDAYAFEQQSPYIELVTSPNNPDGSAREAVVKREGGQTIHDLAYYWPHYSPITKPARHNLMLFTVSKSTGHAGTRIGWALVRDKEVAWRMTKFIELNTIGVSKDSQLRAAKILQAVSDGYQQPDSGKTERFFHYGHALMDERWRRLREVVGLHSRFSLPEFSPEFCNFFNQATTPNPAFAWLKCEGDVEDCETFLKGHGILTRSGKHFGADSKYVRVSLLDRDETFDLLLHRLANIF